MPRKSLFRRLLQLRLATLLALVTLTCISLAVRQSLLVSYTRQAEAVERLRRAGVEVQLEQPPLRWLAAVIGKKKYMNAVTVNCQSTNITDKQLSYLQDLPKLRAVYLADTAITDAGLMHLRELEHVEQLSLNDTNITDEGLRYLAAMRRLRELDLRATRISDDGLRALANFPQLTSLYLGPRITDEGLVHVGKLAALEFVDLQQTWTTASGLSNLAGTRLNMITPPARQGAIRGSELVHLRDLEFLVQLPYSVVKCTDADVDHLRKLRFLTALEIAGKDLTDEAIHVLAELPALKSLRMGGAITPAGIVKLGSTKIDDIQVSTPNIDASDVDFLRLNYRGSPVTPNIEIESPWLTDKDAQEAHEKLTLNGTVHSKLQMKGSTIWTEGGTHAEVVSHDAMLINDWGRLLDFPQIAVLHLHLSDLRQVPIDVVERLPQLKFFTSTVAEFSREGLEPLHSVGVDWTVMADLTVIEDLLATDPSYVLERDRYGHEEYGPWLLATARTKAFRPWPRKMKLSNPYVGCLRSVLSQGDVIQLQLSDLDPAAELSQLSEARQLRDLTLVNCHLDAHQWQQVWNASSIKNLTISNCLLRDRDLAGIERLQNLQRLELIDVLITDKAIEGLAKLKTLRELELGSVRYEHCSPYISPKGLAALQRLELLQEFHVQRVERALPPPPPSAGGFF